jgi:hypothetical protein
MNDLLQWSDTFAQREAVGKQQGRDALTESIGQGKAAQGGASFLDTIDAGRNYLQTSRDPLFELKKLELQTNISEQSAKMADQYRNLKIKDAEMASEQRDKNVLTQWSLQYKGKPTEALNALAAINMESPYGLKSMNDHRMAITEAMDHDAWTKSYTSLTPEGRWKVDAAMQASNGVRTKEVVDVFEAEVQKSKEKLVKDIQPKPITIQLDNGKTMVGVYNPQTGSFDPYKPEKTPTVSGGTISYTGANGEKLTRKATQAELDSVPVALDDNQKKWMADYKSSKAELAAGKNKNYMGLGDSNEKIMADNAAKLKSQGIDPETGTKLAVSPVVETVPSQSDIDYLKAHPDVRDKFESKFGPADKFLK